MTRRSHRPVPTPSLRPSSLRADLQAALPGWIVGRLLVGVTAVAAHLAVDVAAQHHRAAPAHLERGILGWDAERYLQLARDGYEALPLIEVRFFPLVPLAARALDRLLPGGPGAALLVLANLAALALGAALHRVCLAEGRDPAVARRAAWAVALTPVAFVLVWGYTEALWGCLTVGALFAGRRRRWWASAAFGVLAGLARPVAPVLSVALAVEAWAPWRGATARARAAIVAAVAAPIAGSALYLAWVWHTFGDPLLPYTIQQQRRFRGSPSDPVTPMLDTAVRAVTGVDVLALLRVAWAVVLVLLVVRCFREWPASFAVFAALSLLVALSTERLGSFERYGFSAFPVVLAIATTVRGRRAVAAGVVGASALVLYGSLALVGMYTP